ncbi:MAG: hypothetical protein K2X86_10650 [Cytophagaceae bacterium]|nr:hypothetical protein [Cytophagaceae bacterium]
MWRASDGDISGLTTWTDGTLPVELIDLSAEYKNGIVYITWTTIQEKNNKEFEIEKSYDGIIFNCYKKIPGAGNSTSAKTYQVQDEDLDAHDKIHYRLKQYDIDRNISIHQTTEVLSSDHFGEMTVYPNPVEKQESIHIDLYAEDCSEGIVVLLMDQLGNEVFSEVCLGGSYEDNIVINNGHDLKPGLYYIKATSHHHIYQ